MSSITWLLKWCVKAAIFFTLFAFALNNQEAVTVQFFFGRQWTAPMVLVVLAAFACGLLVGILGMVPRWWKHRRDAARARHALKPGFPKDLNGGLVSGRAAGAQPVDEGATRSPDDTRPTQSYPPMPPHGI